MGLGRGMRPVRLRAPLSYWHTVLFVSTAVITWVGLAESGVDEALALALVVLGLVAAVWLTGMTRSVTLLPHALVVRGRIRRTEIPYSQIRGVVWGSDGTYTTDLAPLLEAAREYRWATQSGDAPDKAVVLGVQLAHGSVVECLSFTCDGGPKHERRLGEARDLIMEAAAAYRTAGGAAARTPRDGRTRPAGP